MTAHSYQVPSKLGQDLIDLEAYLRKTLIPIPPRRDFVDGLQKKLTIESPSRPHAYSILQFTLVGLVVGLSGVLLLTAVVRLMVGLIHTWHATRQKRARWPDAQSSEL